MPLKPFIKPIILCLFAGNALQVSFGQDRAATNHHSVKPTTDFDQRFYYTPEETQNVWGYRFGVLINDRFKLGIGGYYMSESADQGIPATMFSRTTAEPLSIHKKLYLGTIYYEPYLLKRKFWEASLVVETGYGRTDNYSVNKKDNAVVEGNNTLFIPAGAGLSINCKLPPLFRLQCMRWLGINIMGGYRTTLYQQDKRYNYNGAYWSLGGAIFLDRMSEDFRAWKRKRAAGRDNRVIELEY